MKEKNEKTINNCRLELLKDYGIQFMPGRKDDPCLSRVYRYGEYIGEVFFTEELDLLEYLKDLTYMTEFMSNYWWGTEGDMVPLVKSIAINYSDDIISTERLQEYLVVRQKFLSKNTDQQILNCVTTWKCIHYIDPDNIFDIDRCIQELLDYFQPNWIDSNILGYCLGEVSNKYFKRTGYIKNLEKDKIIYKLNESVDSLFTELFNGPVFSGGVILSDPSDLDESFKIQALLGQLQFKTSLTYSINYFNLLLSAYYYKAVVTNQSFEEDYEFFQEIIHWKISGGIIASDKISDQMTWAILIDIYSKLLEDTGQEVPRMDDDVVEVVISQIKSH